MPVSQHTAGVVMKIRCRWTSIMMLWELRVTHPAWAVIFSSKLVASTKWPKWLVPAAYGSMV